jgi:hypothetical protein
MNEFISNEDMESFLPEFIRIYKKRPLKNNSGGMGFNHSFGLYVILKKLKLKNIYESGIYKGHSTWLIENTLENFNLVSIDIDLKLREYISSNKNIQYYEGDVEELSFKNVDVQNTLVYFDDHTNVIERLKFLYSWGIKYAIFEDNYPVGQGDAYSIRKILNKSGQEINEWFPNFEEPENRFTSYKTINKIYKRLFYKDNTLPFFLSKYYYYQKKLKKPNSADYDLFKKIVKNHYEIQPTYRYSSQRWVNSDWSNYNESLKPLYEDLENNPFSSDLQFFEQESPNEMYNYTYISLVELKT